MFPGGKGGRCVGLTTLPPSCADCLEIWEPQPPGTLRASNGIALSLPFLHTGCWWRNRTDCDHLVEEIGMDRSMILTPVVKKRYVVMVWMEVTWPTILTTMIPPSAKRRRVS